jgi:hypothetical protein
MLTDLQKLARENADLNFRGQNGETPVSASLFEFQYSLHMQARWLYEAVALAFYVY